MKPHILLTLTKDIAPGRIPHWEAVAQGKATAFTHLTTTVDEVTEKYGLSFQVTREYMPVRDNHWDRHERESGFDRTYRLILRQNSEIPPALIKEIAVIPNVETVTPGRVVTAELPQMTAKSFSLDTDMRSRDAIHLSDAHAYSKGDRQITVAVLDTGINLDHPELADVLLPGYDFVDILDGAGKFVGDYLGYDEEPEDEVGHGTHVAGIIAGKGLHMPQGVVPNCKILPVRVLGAMKRGPKKVGAGLLDNINSGIKWAIDHGADVINMSLGVKQTGSGLPHQAVVEYAQRKGVTIVAASGNDGKEELYYPGALPHVITVGALDESSHVARFSTFGQQVDLVAPGTNIYSTYLHESYGFSTGTSHAAPFVTGAVALLKSYALANRGVHLLDRQIKYLLQQTADKVDQHFKHRKAGFGRLNLIDAVRLLDKKLSE